MAIYKGVGRTVAFLSLNTDGTPNNETTPTVVIDKDGAGQNPAENTPVLQGNGSWKITLTNTEFNADLVVLTAFGEDLVPAQREFYTEADYTSERAQQIDDLSTFDASEDTVLLSTGERIAVADVVLSRNVSNVEGISTANSLCYIVLAARHATLNHLTGVLTVFETNGTTPFDTRQITEEEDRKPIVSVGSPS